MASSVTPDDLENMDAGMIALQALAGLEKRFAKQLADLDEKTRPRTAQELAREKVLQQLDALAGEQAAEEGVIYEGDRFVIPQLLEGDLTAAAKFLTELAKAQETVFNFNRTYPYRPWDGAAAFQRAMIRVFGSTGAGKTIKTFFGEIPPEYIAINVGVRETLRVPWGTFRFEPLEAEFTLGGIPSDDGPMFYLAVEAPRKNGKRIDGFLKVLEDELEKRSIYRGRAIDAHPENPGFVDLSGVSPAEVVYSERTRNDLQANFWSVILYADKLRATGQRLKRAVLLNGAYGSGKTLTGTVTGQIAVQNNWTFMQVRPGDNPYQALKTARLYAPTVVLIEDLDVYMANKSRAEISKLLDALDNASNKGAEVACLFTTNFPGAIERGSWRPGRIDGVVQLGALDMPGYRDLISKKIPSEMLSEDINWDEVTLAYAGYLPAWANEAIGRAIRYALVRTNGEGGQLTTADLTEAAKGLRAQLDMLEEAVETGHDKPTLTDVMTEVMVGAIRKSRGRTE